MVLDNAAITVIKHTGIVKTMNVSWGCLILEFHSYTTVDLVHDTASFR